MGAGGRLERVSLSSGKEACTKGRQEALPRPFPQKKQKKKEAEMGEGGKKIRRRGKGGEPPAIEEGAANLLPAGRGRIKETTIHLCERA